MKHKKKRFDKRDPNELMLREIRRYVERYPDLEPYTNKFTHIVLDRMNSIIYRASIVCNLLGVTEGKDFSFYKRVLNRIESLYPTWEEIRNKVLGGEDVKFPEMSDYSRSKFR